MLNRIFLTSNAMVFSNRKPLNLLLNLKKATKLLTFSTGVREHFVSDSASHIFKHLKDSAHCRSLCSADNFHVSDHASTGFQLKIKEAIHIQREQPSLNQQLHPVNLKLSF